jgi:hypothetical protein
LAGFIREGEGIDNDRSTIGQDSYCVDQRVTITGEKEDFFGNSFPVHGLLKMDWTTPGFIFFNVLRIS